MYPREGEEGAGRDRELLVIEKVWPGAREDGLSGFSGFAHLRRVRHSNACFIVRSVVLIFFGRLRSILFVEGEGGERRAVLLVPLGPASFRVHVAPVTAHAIAFARTATVPSSLLGRCGLQPAHFVRRGCCKWF